MIGGIHLHRIYEDELSTLGNLFIDGRFQCYTLEPTAKRIAPGVYPLTIREEKTPLTIKHREDYRWNFRYHIEIDGVPERDYIYFHQGNTYENSDGCILLGESQYKKGFVGYSAKATERLYNIVYPILQQGYEIPITIG